MKKKVISLLLVFALCLSMGTVALAEDTNIEEVLTESILGDLANGCAYEEFTVIDISSISEGQLANDQSLQLVINDFLSQFPAQTRAGEIYTEYGFGNLYSDSITTASGDNLTYYRIPVVKWEYDNVGDQTNWTTEFFSYNSVELNGVLVNQNDYMNRISFRNLIGRIGTGPEAVFSGYVVFHDNLINSSINVNTTSILAAIANTQSATLGTILSFLSSFNVTSTEATGTTLPSGKNAVAVKFNSNVRIDDPVESIAFTCSLQTLDPYGPKDVPLVGGTLWSFDVYAGYSKVNSGEVGYCDQVMVNYG